MFIRSFELSIWLEFGGKNTYSFLWECLLPLSLKKQVDLFRSQEFCDPLTFPPLKISRKGITELDDQTTQALCRRGCSFKNNIICFIHVNPHVIINIRILHEIAHTTGILSSV